MEFAVDQAVCQSHHGQACSGFLQVSQDRGVFGPARLLTCVKLRVIEERESFLDSFPERPGRCQIQQIVCVSYADRLRRECCGIVPITPLGEWSIMKLVEGRVEAGRADRCSL